MTREIIRGGRSNPEYVARERLLNRERARRKREAERLSNPRVYKYGRLPVNARERHFLKKYGIGLVEREALFTQQGCRCGICNRALSSEDKNTHIDHCHTTGTVRGILCTKCNISLGWYEKVTGEAILNYLQQACDKRALSYKKVDLFNLSH